VRYVRAFGAFWYDFLVGDKWELFVGPIVVLVIAWLAIEAKVQGGVVGAILFAGFCMVGFLSLRSSTRRSP
jgi:uncharacterized membrane protein